MTMKESTVPMQTQKSVAETREESRVLTPPVDIFEITDALVVVADMPGVDKDAIEVNVENDILTIKSVAKTSDKGDVLYKEYELTQYFRQFQLGESVDQERIRAEMRGGVLTVHLPKAEKAKPKKITVQVSS
jgi:HSP20 family molecular chaperone IbpA